VYTDLSAAKIAAVRGQLERLLASSFFKNSKRCAALLAYITEAAVRGETNGLKERTIGIDVFGRRPDYDTNLDPVVRTSAGEVRKRLAQYYGEAGHEAEIRLTLPLGSYIPEFHLPAGQPRAGTPPSQELGVERLREKRKAKIAHSGLLPWSVTAFGVVVLLAVIYMRPWARANAQDQFWRPVFASTKPVSVVVGEPTFFPTTPLGSDPTVEAHVLQRSHVALSDAITLSRLAGVLVNKGKDYRIDGADSVTLTDLRGGPVILVGALDNPWTMRLLDSHRFHFAPCSFSEKTCRIEDGKTPAQKDWQVDFGQPYSKLTQDYAIVARFVDPSIGQTVMVVAGIGENGTVAAGEFATGPQYLEALAAKSPGDWASKNIEVVIATQVIEGRSGPPRVLAVHIW
jgi:hypothetical protein